MFKKPSSRKNIRKREETEETNATEEPIHIFKTVKSTESKKQKKISNAYLQYSSFLLDLVDEFAFKASGDAELSNMQKGNATATLDIDTQQDRDTTAILERTYHSLSFDVT